MEEIMLLKIGTEGTVHSVVRHNGKYLCNFCMNNHLFGTYFHHGFQKEITYCRVCLMHYATTENYIISEDFERQKELIKLNIPFELTDQQKRASQYIVDQFHKREESLLYAVTGAGKTEMMLQSVVEARSIGCNVLITAPRTDVVKELALRLSDYMPGTQIDVLYAGHYNITNSRLVIATVHQLAIYQQHFDLVIVDEIDAFPLNCDKRLDKLLRRALTPDGTMIYLSATPPDRLLKLPHIYLPSRYHHRALPVPKLKYYRVTVKSLSHRLKSITDTTLIFFSDIKQMEQLYEALDESIKQNGTIVYSDDNERHDKVAKIRSGKYKFIFTTTILERGFTKEHLSVWVINSEQFSWDALVQIAGRVDRKGSEHNGTVYYFHEGVSAQMNKAITTIKRMNQKHEDKMH